MAWNALLGQVSLQYGSSCFGTAGVGPKNLRIPGTPLMMSQPCNSVEVRCRSLAQKLAKRGIPPPYHSKSLRHAVRVDCGRLRGSYGDKWAKG